MGLCAYHASEHQKALIYFQKAQWDKADTALLYYERTFYLGACYLQLGDVEAGRSQFMETLEMPKKNATYFNALINLGITYSTEKNFPCAIERFTDAVRSIDVLIPEERASFKALALYSLAKAYREMGNEQQAQIHFQEALVSSSPRQQPAIMVATCLGLNTSESKRTCLTSAVDLIISGNLRPASSVETLEFTMPVFYSLLRELYNVSRPLFERLREHASAFGDFKTTTNSLFLDLAYHSIGARDFKTAIRMARDVADAPVDDPLKASRERFLSLRLLCFLCKGDERLKYQQRYVESLKSGYEPSAIDALDLEVFVDLAADRIKRKRAQESFQYIELA